ncbi:serine hydrolase domain-containing protein [Streptomyces sp. NPDC021020]|uniref:serine hydrolase domain-containing protein n=1 Tax=Streptomyces sp. NPDC021020 TaxID=3365109 RepID=UPI0037A288B7
MAVAGGAVMVLVAAAPGEAAARTPTELQREVDALRGTGVVGVGAEVLSAQGDVTARAGTARAGAREGMPADGRFRIGSASKTFTATVVLQLVGEGKLSLDDTVDAWLPGVVRGNGNDGRGITVRQLLQHTSHVPDDAPEIPALNTAQGYAAERYRAYTPAQLVALAMAEPRVPGDGWTYSNTNYTLAAMIIARVTGRSWAQEVTGRVIRPLGLEDTSAPGAFPFVTGPHAHSYATFNGTSAPTDVTVLDPSMAVGSGALISSTHDLARFYTALLGGRLLAPAQLAEMTSTVPAPDLGVDYGLGLGRIPLSCGGSYYGHPGELLGYHTWGGVTQDGTRSAVVYVTSDGGPDTQAAMGNLVDRELCAGR